PSASGTRVHPRGSTGARSDLAAWRDYTRLKLARWTVSLGPLELIVILVIVLVIFGGGRIGDLGSALGKTIREFKGAVRDEDRGVPGPVEPSPTPTASTTEHAATASDTAAAAEAKRATDAASATAAANAASGAAS